MRTLLKVLWAVGIVIGRVRAARARRIDYARIYHPHQVRGRGMRFTEHLRDLLRPSWLRLRR